MTDKLYEAYKAEVIQHQDKTFTVEFSLPFLIALIGQLQLALRHPNNKGPSTEQTRNFISYAKHHLLQDMPTIQKVIDMGFDERFDR